LGEGYIYIPIYPPSLRLVYLGWTTATRRSPDCWIINSSLLQSMLNAPAWLHFSAISPLLRDLHWLRVPQRIKFKLALLTYRCLHSTAPPYLVDELPTPQSGRPRLATASEVGVHINTRCTADVPLHHWRSIISSRGFVCMEQSAA